MGHTLALKPLAMRARKSPQPNAEPNVIPFIDVLLVLLIIFMVTAPKPTVDIPVDLPQGHAPVLIGDPTIIVLRESGAGPLLYVGEEQVDMATLADRTLAHVIANNPQLMIEDMYAEARVFLRADQSTAYANVVDVMETLKDSGFARVGIFAETAQEN